MSDQSNKKLFQEPKTLTLEDSDGNLHTFEGCYTVNIDYNYPADGPIVVERPSVEFFKTIDPPLVEPPKMPEVWGNPRTFEQAWAEKEAEGYQYGEDALEQVRFGWEMAMAELKRRT